MTEAIVTGRAAGKTWPQLGAELGEPDWRLHYLHRQAALRREPTSTKLRRVNVESVGTVELRSRCFSAKMSVGDFATLLSKLEEC